MRTIEERLAIARNNSEDGSISKTEIIRLMDIHIIDLTKALAESEQKLKEVQALFTEKTSVLEQGVTQLGLEEKKGRALADALSGLTLLLDSDDQVIVGCHCTITGTGLSGDCVWCHAEELLSLYAKDEVKND